MTVDNDHRSVRPRALLPVVRRAVELRRGPAALLDWLARRQDADALARELGRTVAAAATRTPSAALGTILAIDETRRSLNGRETTE
jgi:hypothetical protein